MRVKELVEKLRNLDQEKSIRAQVCAEDGTTWNMWFEVNDIPGSQLVQLRVSHTELKTLPSVEQTQ